MRTVLFCVDWKTENSVSAQTIVHGERDARAERRRALFWRWIRSVLTLGLWRR